MNELYTTADRVALAAEAIRRRAPCRASTAIILGTGLGRLADEIAAATVLPYSEIPGFPHCSALAHEGRLVCGSWNGTPVIAMQGRCHLYEGYDLDDLTLPVRALAALGIKTLIVTNAAGGLNPDFALGDVMLIDDHINLMGPRAQGAGGRGQESGVRSQGSGVGGPRWGRLYDRELCAAAERIARHGDFPLQRGVYVAVTGPTYETRAEYRAFRRIGGDCVGMSTVPEVLTAVVCRLRVLGLSIITNVACPDAPKKVSAQEVVEVSATAVPKVRRIVDGIAADAAP